MTRRAHDIRTQNSEYQKLLEAEFKVTTTPEDILFYKDDCHGHYVVTITVPHNWTKQLKRSMKRQLSIDRKKLQIESTERGRGRDCGYVEEAAV